MPQFRFRNFNNLAFFQAIDMPGRLGRLLTPHAAYFAGRGLDVTALTNDDACARHLLEVFTHPTDDMPGTLLQALHLLDALADENGYERILEEAARRRIDLRPLDDDLCPGDFALEVWFAHPHLIRVCHQKAVGEKVRRYYEYRSRDHRRVGLLDVQGKLPALEGVLGPWFDGRKRSPTCEIFAYQEGGEIRVLVTHGALFRTDGSITNRQERSRVAYRPQRHDFLLYDTATGGLLIHAQFPAEREAYRTEFGRALFADPAFFVESRPYTLAPLRTSGGRLTLVDGLDNVRLTEVRVASPLQPVEEQLLKGDDLTATIAAAAPQGDIVQATFQLKRTDGGRARKLDIRLPNIAEYDREHDGSLVRAFLTANGFLRVEANDVGTRGLVEAA